MQVRGTIRGTRQGFAFLAPDEGGEEIYISAVNLGEAIHGDRVSVSIIRDSAYDFRAEGVVESIIERPNPIFTGDVVRVSRTIFVLPDSPVLPNRIRLKTGRQSVPQGSKVLFKVDRARAGSPLVAVLDRILGDAEDPAHDSVVVATAYHLPVRFPDAALDEAVAAASEAESKDYSSRYKYTDRLVLTIDPKTAKDFDDAVSVQRDSDSYRLQVHIADVSSMVAEGGPLDAEALRRGTSVYFPGSVIPMLPEILSNGAASLVPDADRPVLTVEIDIDFDGSVRETRIREGLIRSAARLTYESAQKMLDGDEGDPELRDSLRTMAELARLLRKNRFRAGGVDLELPETEMTLDATGVPRRLWRHRTFESNRIIEEFMILANRAVGRFVVERGMPLLFRVHGEPDPAALENFASVAMTLSPGSRPRDLDTLPALRRFLSSLPSGPLTRIVHSFFLRSMKKAVYSSIDLGHFGLGIDRYCHFTSPIRRYPDLLNHRIVRWLIRETDDDDNSAEEARRWQGAALVCGPACSKSEQRAEAAESEMIRLKILRWASRRLGESFSGRIVGLLPAGLFVELDKLPVEGFVPREGFTTRARYVEERLAFLDRRGGFELRLGDSVKVTIARVDLRERHLDFQLVEVQDGRKSRERKRSHRDAKGRRGRGRGSGVAAKGRSIKKRGARADRVGVRVQPKGRNKAGRRRGGRR